MTRVYSFDFRHPDGDIYRIRGAGQTKKQAVADAARRFQEIHGVPMFGVDMRTATFIPEKDRGEEGL